jgi:hypothetical protein
MNFPVKSGFQGPVREMVASLRVTDQWQLSGPDSTIAGEVEIPSVGDRCRSKIWVGGGNVEAWCGRAGFGFGFWSWAVDRNPKR